MPDNDAIGRAVELIKVFVNTYDVESGTDDWADPELLSAWLRDRALPAGAVGHEELERARTVREGLRRLLLANHDATSPERAAIDSLNEASAGVPLSVRFRPDGGADLHPATDGVEAALAQVLAAVHTLMAEGSWIRLKACRRESCRWAFFDQSRNRSRNWCSMEVCGNRTKAEAFRERHTHV